MVWGGGGGVYNGGKIIDKTPSIHTHIYLLLMNFYKKFNTGVLSKRKELQGEVY